MIGRSRHTAQSRWSRTGARGKWAGPKRTRQAPDPTCGATGWSCDFSFDHGEADGAGDAGEIGHPETAVANDLHTRRHRGDGEKRSELICQRDMDRHGGCIADCGMGRPDDPARCSAMVVGALDWSAHANVGFVHVVLLTGSVVAYPSRWLPAAAPRARCCIDVTVVAVLMDVQLELSNAPKSAPPGRRTRPRRRWRKSAECGRWQSVQQGQWHYERELGDRLPALSAVAAQMAPMGR